MSVYKPSNANPLLTEIDVTQNNTFTTLVNTSGEPIKAYKMKILNSRGDEVIYDPNEPTQLAQPIKNKDFLEISGIQSNMVNYVPVGTNYYSTPALDSYVGKLTEPQLYYWNELNGNFTIIINNVTYYIEPVNYCNKGTGVKASFVNEKDYQWGVRTYASNPDSLDQPTTVVCEGYTVGSTKYVIWMRLPDHGEKGVNKTIADNIVYDRYILLKATSASDIILGGHDKSDKVKPTCSLQNPYIERKKIDWVEKELGNDKDIIKIETEKDFEYNFVDGVSFDIYQCSSDHTVTSAFADPNTNINISNFIMIYANAATAESARAAGDTPEQVTVSPVHGSRKITGYSLDTGEIRVMDAWSTAPLNGMAYRIFSQNASTKKYTELFTADLTFKVPVGTSYYKSYVSKDVKYYSNPQCTGTESGTLTADTQYEFVYPYSSDTSVLRYSTITKSGTTYYILTPLPEATATSVLYNAASVSAKYGTFLLDSVTYYVPYSSLLIYKGNTQTTDPYSYQLIGGNPVTPSNYYKVLSNRWDATATRLFIQPNINIKSDRSNPNEIVFDNGTRIDIIEQYYFNTLTYKKVDITLNKLDDTLWLIENNSRNVSGLSYTYDSTVEVPVAPQTDYTIYTDFMDSSPMNFFYARSTPEISITYKDLHDEESGFETLNNYSIYGLYGYRLNEGAPYYSSIVEATATQPVLYYNDPNLTQEAGSIRSNTYCRFYCEKSIGGEYHGIATIEVDENIYYIDSGTEEGTISYLYSANNFPIVDILIGEGLDPMGYAAFYIGSNLYFVPTKERSGFVGTGQISNLAATLTYINNYLYGTVTISGFKYYFVPPVIQYRDISFKANTGNWSSIKYYRYQIYDESNTLIKESDNIYSSDLEYSFRGLASIYTSKPTFYTVKILITDDKDKEFTQQVTFGVFYKNTSPSTLIPLSIELDCDNEKCFTVSTLDPLDAVSTDYNGHPSVDSADIVRVFDEYGQNGYLRIPTDEVLNYDTVLDSLLMEVQGIVFGSSVSQLFQFRLSSDFLRAIGTSGSGTVMSFDHGFPSAKATWDFPGRTITTVTVDVNKFSRAYSEGVYRFIYSAQTGWKNLDLQFGVNTSTHKLTITNYEESSPSAIIDTLNHVLKLNSLAGSVNEENKITFNTSGVPISLSDLGIAIVSSEPITYQEGDKIIVSLASQEEILLKATSLVASEENVNPGSLQLYRGLDLETPLPAMINDSGERQTYYSIINKMGQDYQDPESYNSLWITAYIVVNSNALSAENTITCYLDFEELEKEV